MSYTKLEQVGFANPDAPRYGLSPILGMWKRFRRLRATEKGLAAELQGRCLCEVHGCLHGECPSNPY